MQAHSIATGAPGEAALVASPQDSTQVAAAHSSTDSDNATASTEHGNEKRVVVDKPSNWSGRWFPVRIPDDCFYRIVAYLVVDDLFAASHTSRVYAASLTPAVLPSLRVPPFPHFAGATAETDSRPKYQRGACEVDSGSRVAIGNQQLEFLCRKFPDCATLRLPVVCSKLSIDGIAAALRSLPCLTDLEVGTRA
jgi:hypothetical protein